MLKDLETKIQSYIAESDSEMGVAVHHIESDQQIMINADRLYPLASVVKVPILVEAFHQMAEGKLRLDDRWTVTKDLGTVGSGLLPVPIERPYITLAPAERRELWVDLGADPSGQELRLVSQAFDAGTVASTTGSSGDRLPLGFQCADQRFLRNESRHGWSFRA